MKIKSTVLHVLAVACMGVGLLYGMGIEGGAQLGQPVSDGEFITALVLVLAAVFSCAWALRRRTPRSGPTGKSTRSPRTP